MVYNGAKFHDSTHKPQFLHNFQISAGLFAYMYLGHETANVI